MAWNCLVVDLLGKADDRVEQVSASGIAFSLELNFVSNIDEATIVLNTGSAVAMVVFADGYGPEVETLLRIFQDKIGAMPQSQLIVADEPNPRFLAGAFEFGIEQFASMESWLPELADFCDRVAAPLADSTSTESKNIEMARAIRERDQRKINGLAGEIKEAGGSDYRAAFARGRAFEATGQYTEALGEFTTASKLNKMFRPSDTSKAQTLLLTGKVDEALEIFQKLERSNNRDVGRKAFLASAYIEKGDLERAKEYLAEGAALQPGHSRLVEVNAQLLLATGKIPEAFLLMDQMSEAGPLFAGKLNELGIRLSQAGKGKSALALYQKAHKIVRAELKYKISLNASLACRRLKEYEMALKYISRCRKEFGGSFEKLDKIEEGIKALIISEGAEEAKRAV